MRENASRDHTPRAKVQAKKKKVHHNSAKVRAIWALVLLDRPLIGALDVSLSLSRSIGRENSARKTKRAAFIAAENTLIA